MNSPRILSFIRKPINEREPPDLNRIRPHEWFQESLLSRYNRRREEDGYFELYISKLAAEKMTNHAYRLGKTQKEALGFILGDVCRSEGREFVMGRDIVTSSLISSSNRVSFDRESLPHLFSELDSSGFDYVIIGWYHSHPGYGCFMSKVDINTQLTMFSESYHSAVVVDPISKEMQAFKLRDEQCEIRDFAIYWHELEKPYGQKIVRRSRVTKRVK